MYLTKTLLAGAAAIMMMASTPALADHSWYWDYPHDPSAGAAADAGAYTGMTGYADTVAATNTSTSTYADTDGWWSGPEAGFSAGASGITGGDTIDFGYGAGVSGLALNAEGYADASWDDVSASASLGAVAVSEGVGDIVFIEQSVGGDVFVSGHDEAGLWQNAYAGGSGFTSSSVGAYSFGENVAAAASMTASGVSISTQTNN